MTYTLDNVRPLVRPTRRVSNVAYLDALARRSDEAGLNRPHLERVLQARRDRDNFANPSVWDDPGTLHPASGQADAPGPIASPIVRALPIVALFAVICGGMFVPRPVQLGIGAGLVVVACVAAWRVR
jgi:hypothetical protein